MIIPSLTNTRNTFISLEGFIHLPRCRFKILDRCLNRLACIIWRSICVRREGCGRYGRCDGKSYGQTHCECCLRCWVCSLGIVINFIRLSISIRGNPSLMFWKETVVTSFVVTTNCCCCWWCSFRRRRWYRRASDGKGRYYYYIGRRKNYQPNRENKVVKRSYSWHLGIWMGIVFREGFGNECICYLCKT